MFGKNRRSLPLNTGGIMMPMSIRVPIIKPVEPPIPTQTQEGPIKRQMIWGEPTWFFLHTVAEKVKPESFAIVRGDLLKHIYNVCTNLPCPFCAKHAKIHLDSINFSRISSKEELKMMLYTFHNIVNAKKNYPIFPREELDAKYSLANTRKIFTHFIVHFNDTYRAPGMIADDLFRKQLSKALIEWFNQNNIHFD
jgi:hypothetical protein